MITSSKNKKNSTVDIENYEKTIAEFISRAGNKGKKGKQREKRLSKQKLLKGCHQGQSVTVSAILERLEFKIFSGLPTMVADNTCQCFMAPLLWNPFRRPWSAVSVLPGNVIQSEWWVLSSVKKNILTERLTKRSFLKWRSSIIIKLQKIVMVIYWERRNMALNEAE